MALRVSHCCCGCSLRSGTKIIAVYLLVCSVLLTVYSATMFGVLNSHVDHHRLIFWRYNIQNFNSETYLKLSFFLAMVGGISTVILNSLLLVGVHKEKKNLLSVWLVYYVFILAGIVISLVVSFFQFFINPYYQLGTLIHIGLIIYFLLVVRSYHHSLSDGHNRQQNAADVFDIENSNIKRMPLA